MVALTHQYLSHLFRPAGRPDAPYVPRYVSTAFWLVTALAHTPALAGVWQAMLEGGFNAAHLLPCILLTGSMALFLLKVGNVRFLRTKGDRNTCLIFCVAVAFLHVDVAYGSQDRVLAVGYHEIVITTLVAGRLLLLRHESRATRASDHGRTTTDSHQPIFDRQALTDSFLTHSWTLVRQAFGVRAPPACRLA